MVNSWTPTHLLSSTQNLDWTVWNIDIGLSPMATGLNQKKNAGQRSSHGYELPNAKFETIYEVQIMKSLELGF